MIRLDSTARLLQVKLTGAITTNPVSVVISYRDSNQATGISIGGTQVSTVSGTTAVEVCAMPSGFTAREVDYISVNNNDTVSATPTIYFIDGATAYPLMTQVLAAGDTLVYCG